MLPQIYPTDSIYSIFSSEDSKRNKKKIKLSRQSKPGVSQNFSQDDIRKHMKNKVFSFSSAINMYIYILISFRFKICTITT